VISVQAVTKRYGERAALDAVSFDVGRGEAVALWGPNGAGKSTAIRCVLGAIRFEGSVRIGGFDVARSGKAARRLVGYVPQHLAFFDDLTVEDTVALSTTLRSVPLERGLDVLGDLGLADHRTKAVGALSGGLTQRLAIALALVADPPVLLLDEPTSSLDVAARESVLEVFERLRDQERSILLSSHHLDEVGVLADRVLAMDAGRITLEADPADLAAQLGLRAWLHVVLDTAAVSRALEVLGAAGFGARRNGRGVLVEVSAAEKAGALTCLAGAGLDVLDVDVWR
jgi:ABC-type multidrug transport system ATPase subunit